MLSCHTELCTVKEILRNEATDEDPRSVRTRFAAESAARCPRHLSCLSAAVSAG